jgi:hypothetical protein
MAVLAVLGGRAAAQVQPLQAPAPMAAPGVMHVEPDVGAAVEAQIEQWVFQQDHSSAQARRKLESQLTIEVDDIDRACKLTDLQKAKLQLAGRGDIKRFFDRVEGIKQKSRLKQRANDHFNEVFQDVQPLQSHLQAGLFGPDSLLRKSLSSTLNNAQKSQYDSILRERSEFRHRATIELILTMVEQGTPLRDSQRRDFAALLSKHTRPAPRPSQYEYMLVLRDLGRLPEAKVKAIFDRAQWRTVSLVLNQYRGMDPFLRQNGLLQEGEDVADRPLQPVQPAIIAK